MGFTDNLKRSLGFEETESSGDNSAEGPNFTEMFQGVTKNIKTGISNIQENLQNNSHGSDPAQNQDYEPDINQSYNPNFNPNHTTAPRPAPVYEVYEDDYVIVPEQTYYEIVLSRPKSIDDVNYVVDQVLEEKNPVILDLSFLERESPANYKLAAEKIKNMRTRYGAQAVLLDRTEEKHLIIISPKKVKLVNKN